uniref:Uncharacterized protein n=1 Tax=Arundo donax TaxID=35708 RepID=A0A0A9GXW9_ARUDO
MPQLQRAAPPKRACRGLGAPKGCRRSIAHFACHSSPVVWRTICPQHLRCGRSCGTARLQLAPNTPLISGIER